MKANRIKVPKVQLYYVPTLDMWRARTNVPGLKIDMNLTRKRGLYPHLRREVVVT